MSALVTVFFTSFIIAFSGAMMPGPLLVTTISESARRGSMTGPLLILGHAILEAALVLALLFGLAPLLKSDRSFIIIALAGSAILLWMAYSMFRSLPTLSVDWKINAAPKGGLVTSGIVMSLSNPYWFIWWATIGLGYILYSQKFGTIGIILFFIGHILGDLIWYSAISVIVAKGKHLLTVRIYRTLIGICAVFLACFALWFAYSGVIKLKLFS